MSIINPIKGKLHASCGHRQRAKAGVSTLRPADWSIAGAWSAPHGSGYGVPGRKRQALDRLGHQAVCLVARWQVLRLMDYLEQGCIRLHEVRPSRHDAVSLNRNGFYVIRNPSRLRRRVRNQAPGHHGNRAARLAAEPCKLSAVLAKNLQRQGVAADPKPVAQRPPNEAALAAKVDFLLAQSAHRFRVSACIFPSRCACCERTQDFLVQTCP
jgi:hypothetical protein